MRCALQGWSTCLAPRSLLRMRAPLLRNVGRILAQCLFLFHEAICQTFYYSDVISKGVGCVGKVWYLVLMQVQMSSATRVRPALPNLTSDNEYDYSAVSVVGESCLVLYTRQKVKFAFDGVISEKHVAIFQTTQVHADGHFRTSTYSAIYYRELI
jgi:hypothetical protein